MKIFVDANIFYASFDSNDTTHKKVINTYKKVPQDAILCTSTQTLSEAATLISQRLGKKQLELFLKTINESFVVIYINHKIAAKAQEIILKTKSKNISFADCTTIAICKTKKYKIDALFTFDKHFNNKGIKLLS